MTLPYDYARCNGHMQTRSDRFLNISIGQTECLNCGRREPGRPDNQVMMMPPKFIGGKCPSRIWRGWERNEGNDGTTDD